VIIAIDGPAASGKGTVARRLATDLGFAYLDTGALYRAVGLSVVEQGLDPADASAALAAARSLAFDAFVNPRLRDEDIGVSASKVAAFPEVREVLLRYQRNFAEKPPDGAPGAVIDGRDIGTVVCPNAEIKLFVTASTEERARRRAAEMRAAGRAANEAQIVEDLVARDRRDIERASSPLRQANDAHLLDTTNLDIEAAFTAALAIVNASALPRD